MNGNILKLIHWIHHASFMIEAGGRVIYIDPFKIKDNIPADYIFVTHAHFDHFSVNDIDSIIKEGTVIICPDAVAKELKGYNFKKIKPGDTFELEGIKCEATPAYNIEKNFHPKNDDNVGYIIEIEGARIYNSGDTDYIPEMNDLKDITVALVPVAGTYTMNPKEAARAVNAFKPQIAVPMHFGELVVGDMQNAEEFKKLVKEPVKVEIMTEEG